MLRLSFTLLLAYLSLISGYSHAEADKNNSASETVTVVELFTSQGCYSCPPADDLLAELDKQSDIIALSCHVTYWNYLGWKDTFSKAYCDNRQRTYQSTLIGNPGVYTPQMVINGRYGTVGSRQRTVEQAISIMRRENRLQALGLSQGGDNRLSVTLPAIETTQRYQLTLLGTTGTQTVPINRGENGGKTLDYHNPIKVIEHLGRWNGEAKIIQQKVADNAGVKEWVVLAQTWPIGEIVAAGKLTLAK